MAPDHTNDADGGPRPEPRNDVVDDGVGGETPESEPNGSSETGSAGSTDLPQGRGVPGENAMTEEYDAHERTRKRDDEGVGGPEIHD